MMQHRLIVLATLGLLGCGGSNGGSAPTSPDPSIARIDIDPAPLVLSRGGATVQFRAIVRDGSGREMTVPGNMAWASGNLTVATIASSGAATAVATVLPRCTNLNCGTCTRITATAGGVVGETHLAYEGSIAEHPCPAQ